MYLLPLLGLLPSMQLASFDVVVVIVHLEVGGGGVIEGGVAGGHGGMEMWYGTFNSTGTRL